MATISRLIKKIASNPSTEELILFIADDDKMVKECLELQKRLETKNKRDLANLDAQCRSHKISRDMLSREVHRILAIFSPDTFDDEFAVLGLKANADLKQVKDAFRKLSIKYHPDSSGNDDSNKFIEICQAYKAIVSRSGSDKPTTHEEKTASWRYTKKRELSPQLKRRNIYLFSTLGIILLIISVIAPYIYRKKIMLQNLNSADPILVSRPEISDVPLAQKKSGPSKPTADSDARLEYSRLQDDGFKISTAEPETVKLIPAPIKQESTLLIREHSTNVRKPEPKKQLPLSSKPEPGILTLTPASKKQKIPVVMIRAEIWKHPSISGNPDPGIIILNQVLKKQKPSAAITKAQPQKQPPITQNFEPEIQDPESISQPHEPAKGVNKVESARQSPVTSSLQLKIQIINDFIHAYTSAYKSKNLQQFSRFFTPTALENGHSFTEQQEKYSALFRSVDTIGLNIDILSSKLRNETIELKGRFQINLTYPQGQLIQKRGHILFLLTENNRQYLIKELNYTFDKAK